MFETKIRIEFMSDWLAGSGLGSGPLADSILYRDGDGLPCISGRAMKGALREGAWRLGLCRADLGAVVDCLWGTESVDAPSNTPGLVKVGPARLPEDISAWLLNLPRPERAQYVSDMTIIRTQTALDEGKMVKPQSLRSMECGIPGLFFLCHVSIDAPSLDRAWLQTYLCAVCAAVKSVGADRARGLGNCRISLADHADKAAIPGQVNVNLLKGGRNAIE